MKIYIALIHNWEETGIVSAHVDKTEAEEAAKEAFTYYYDEGEYGQWHDTVELDLELDPEE